MYSNNINLMFRGKCQLFSTLQEKNLGEIIYPQKPFIIIWIWKQIHKIKFKTSKNLIKYAIDSMHL